MRLAVDVLSGLQRDLERLENGAMNLVVHLRPLPQLILARYAVCRF